MLLLHYSAGTCKWDSSSWLNKLPVVFRVITPGLSCKWDLTEQFCTIWVPWHSGQSVCVCACAWLWLCKRVRVPLARPFGRFPSQIKVEATWRTNCGQAPFKWCYRNVFVSAQSLLLRQPPSSPSTPCPLTWVVLASAAHTGVTDRTISLRRVSLFASFLSQEWDSSCSCPQYWNIYTWVKKL